MTGKLFFLHPLAANTTDQAHVPLGHNDSWRDGEGVEHPVPIHHNGQNRQEVLFEVQANSWARIMRNHRRRSLFSFSHNCFCGLDHQWLSFS